jgi:putative flippase GtrA
MRFMGPASGPSSPRRELIAYLVFGALTTLINIGAYALLTRVAGIPYLVSNVIAWVASIAFAYVTNKLWVFGSRSADARTLAREIAAFVSGRLASGLLDTGLMYALVGLARLNDVEVKVFVNILVIAFNYGFSKLVVFRSAGPEAGGA